jgi:hypothetical protein
MSGFLEALRTQRWDDHRFYHHSRINQALHLLSALSFITAYVLLFVNPPLAALLGWLVSMVARQSGHFFFEPRGFDHVNQVSDEYKEAVKVGYNIRRKIVLLAIWIASPLLLLASPSLFGLLQQASTVVAFAMNVGWLWLSVGIVGLLFRTVQLCLMRDWQTGLVWLAKILTDPFHDVMLYHRAPLQLLRGEWLDPMDGEQRA